MEKGNLKGGRYTFLLCKLYFHVPLTKSYILTYQQINHCKSSQTNLNIRNPLYNIILNTNNKPFLHPSIICIHSRHRPGPRRNHGEREIGNVVVPCMGTLWFPGGKLMPWRGREGRSFVSSIRKGMVLCAGMDDNTLTVPIRHPI